MSVAKLLTSWTPFDVSKDAIQESKARNGGKIVLKGILQKADTLNQNGRIYPLAILEREVRNYQKFIRERRALGECVDGDTMIFTKRGWLHFDDVKDDEVVFTLDISSGELREEKIVRKIKKIHQGKMLHFRNGSGSLDMKLTPNHIVLLYDRHGKPVEMTAQDVYNLYKEKSSWLSHCGISNRCVWKGEELASYTIPGTEIEVDPHVWAAFLGIYLAEGCASGVKGGSIERREIQITQKKPENIEKIRLLLQQFPIAFKEYVRADGLTVDFKIKHSKLHAYLYELGHSSIKYVPSDVKQWSSDLLTTLLDWLLLGDGRNRVMGGRLVRELYTTSPLLANDVAEIFMKIGVGSNIQTYLQKDREIEPGRMILAENSKPMHIVSENRARHIGLDLRFMTIDEVDHDDYVYCVETPSSTWMAKRDGKMFWTHNCDHPDSSVVELKNASHLITRAWMEGNVCYGEVELLDTPSGKILQSLVESGVTLGISSRGVGSTRSEGDRQIVQDDFQLICWDFVSEPSTPGAFMMKEGKEVNTDTLNKHFTKSDKVARIFNEIIDWKNK